MNLTAIDIVFILVIAIFMIRCYLKGFVSEVLSVAAVVLGLVSALYFFKNGGEFLKEKYMPNNEIVAKVIAFIAIFLIVFLVVKIFEMMLKNIIEGIQLGGADRFLGFIFGLAEGLVVVSLVLFLLMIQPLFNPTAILSDSFFASALLPLITGMGRAAGV